MSFMGIKYGEEEKKDDKKPETSMVIKSDETNTNKIR